MQQPSIPPGPDVAPASNLFAMRRDPVGFFMKLAADYGDIVRFSLGADDMHLVNHPDLIKEVLVTSDRHFVKWFAIDRTKELLGEGLFVSEGDFHLRQRRLSQPAFHHKRIAGYAKMMSDCCCELRDRWREGETLDVSQEMNWLTMVIVTKTLFGAEMDSAEANVIRESLNDILDLFERATLPPDELELFNQSRARLDATVYRLIKERRESGSIDRGDLLSMLLLAHDEENGGGGMTDLQIHDEAMTIFLAGHETTANALTWAWYLLSQHPEVEARMHGELDRVLGGNPPQMEDVKRLPYVEKIFSEAMRLYPPVWVVGRRALQDVEIGGYKIVKGAIVLVSQYVTHHDARYFPEPFRFDPERWNPEAVAARPKFSYFPFSAGSRQCLGEAFAWMESVLAIAILAQRWRLGLAPGHRVELQPQLTLRPKNGMRMRAECR
jgi:cytochrome P450